MAQTIEIRPTGAALGADVRGVDFGDLDEPTLHRIREALGEHLVLRFRGTELSDTDYMALGRRLGEIVPPEAHTRTADMTAPDFPEMSVISNIVEGGVAKGEAGDGELRWHTDHGFMERPAAYTMLLAREVPAQGGDTSFVNMCRAHDEMADDLRARAAPCRSSIRRATARPASRGRAMPTSPRATRASCQAQSIRSCAPTRRAAARRSISGGGSAPTSRRCRSRRARRCSMRCGPRPPATS
jgi:taurine dioxygenase